VYIRRGVKVGGHHQAHHLRKVNITRTLLYSEANCHLQSNKMLFSTLTFAALMALSAAVPTTISKRFPSGSEIIRQYKTYTYNDMTIFQTDKSNVTREFPNGRQISTLVTMKVPSTPLPETCSLRFSADPNTLTLSNPSDPSNSRALVDVFTSWEPVPDTAMPAGGWKLGNKRDQHLGRLIIDLKQTNKDNIVRVEDPNTRLGKGFPCPKAGVGNVTKDGRFAFELTYVGQEGWVKWDGRVNGLYMT
jgi:hypothetical protein